MKLPAKPAALKLAESNLGEVQKRARLGFDESAKSLLADREADRMAPSTRSLNLMAADEVAKTEIKAARTALETERTQFQPEFNRQMAIPLAELRAAIENEIERLDLLAQGVLQIHSFATYAGLESPCERMAGIVDVVRGLRIAMLRR